MSDRSSFAVRVIVSAGGPLQSVLQQSGDSAQGDAHGGVSGAGDVLAAIADGRVFVDGKRIRDASFQVPAGATVSIGRRSLTGTPVWEVLHHDQDFIAVSKPAGLSTIPDERGDLASLLGVVAKELGRPQDTIHPTSRLDREVSGVVTFALSARGRELAADARKNGAYDRRYVALAALNRTDSSSSVSSTMAIDQVLIWDQPLSQGRKVRCDPSGAPSLTRARLVARAGDAAEVTVGLLSVAPQTGRTHQIRVHASAAGAPLLGDRLYGGPPRLTLAGSKNAGKVLALTRVALHALRVTIPNVLPRPLIAEVPSELRALWASLGGRDEAWEEASICAL